MTIDIAVPIYNCAKWLDAFFESLLGQDDSDWHMIARDDGSGDDSIAIAQAWRQRLGARMTVIDNPSRNNLGPVGSYNVLLEACTSDLVMLADPDDVWKPNKISLSRAAMSGMEAKYGREIPLVLFTDAEVIDEQGSQFASSYWKWSGMDQRLCIHFRRMLVESAAISSTMLVNRAALRLALPITGSFSLQDWWIALVACAFGKIAYLNEKTVFYRRHSANDSVAPMTRSLSSTLGNLFLAKRRVNALLEKLSPHAAAFLARFGDRLSPTDLMALKAAAGLQRANPIVRRLAIARHGLWFASPLKNAGLMVLL